jgi:preprotein translocase subunit YajC
MEAVIVLAASFGLLWVLFIWPQQRRVRSHQQLVATLQEGDEIVMTAGIYGRVTSLGPEDMIVEVAPDIELRVARMAVLRRVEDAVSTDDRSGDEDDEDDEPADNDPPSPTGA